MQSDGAVNLLCSGDLACEDAKLLDGESERGAPRSYTRPASLLHGHTNRARSGPLLPTLCYASTTRALGATQIIMRQAGRADRTRRGGARTHVSYARCAGKRSPGCVSLVSQSLKPKESILTAIMQMWYMQLKQQA